MAAPTSETGGKMTWTVPWELGNSSSLLPPATEILEGRVEIKSSSPGFLESTLDAHHKGGNKKMKSCAFKTAEILGLVCYPGTRQSVLADSESSSFPPGTDLRRRNASQQLRGWEKCTCFYVFRLRASLPYCLWEFVFFLLLSFLVPNLFLICFPCWASTTSYFPRLFLVAPFYPEGNSSHLDAQGFFSSF